MLGEPSWRTQSGKCGGGQGLPTLPIGSKVGRRDGLNLVRAGGTIDFCGVGAVDFLCKGRKKS